MFLPRPCGSPFHSGSSCMTNWEKDYGEKDLSQIRHLAFEIKRSWHVRKVCVSVS